MTTHLRARALQAGALLALVVGGVLAVTGSPALADGPNVQITNLSSTSVQSGGRTTLNYTVTNTNPLPGPAQINVTTGGMTCNGDCNPFSQIGAGETKQFTADLIAPQVAPGQSRKFQVQVSAHIGSLSDQASAQVTVSGADKPQTVREVNGRVKDQAGKPVPGASVGLQDSQNHRLSTTSNDDGRFRFPSTDAQPILAGNISVGALKEGYTTVSVNVQGSVGKTITVPLTIQAKDATSSATPSPSASVSTEATDEATDPATDQASQPAAADPQNAAQNGSGSGSLLFIILGVLLVAAGIGAIVLVVMRRKNAGDDGSGLPGPGGPGGVPLPAGGGGFNRAPDATRIAAPVSGATMLAARSGPSIGDAPTMLQQAVPLEDEFPDPYGAPSVPNGGYAGAGGYGTATPYGGGAYGGAQVPAQPGGYEPAAPSQYGRPPAPEEDPYGAYGAPQPAGPYGGGGQPRYDEQTGMYRPEANGGYAPAGGGQDPGYGAGGYRGGQGHDGGYGPEPEYPPAVHEPEYPPAGREPEYPPAGREPEYPPAGREPEYPPAGREPEYPPAGREPEYPLAGREPEYPPAGREPGYSPAGRGRGETSGAYQAGGGYPAGGYLPEQPDQGGYGSLGAAGGGIDSDNAYGPPAGGGQYGGPASGGGQYGGPPAGGTYGGPGGGNYGPPAGGRPYGRPDDDGDQGGYDPRATYGRPEPYDRGQPAPSGYGGGEPGGYGAEQYGAEQEQAGYYGGADSGTGRHGGQPRQQPPESNQRRPLDWLDD